MQLTIDLVLTEERFHRAFIHQIKLGIPFIRATESQADNSMFSFIPFSGPDPIAGRVTGASLTFITLRLKALDDGPAEQARCT